MKKIITLIFFSFVFYLSKEILVFNEEIILLCASFIMFTIFVSAGWLALESTLVTRANEIFFIFDDLYALKIKKLELLKEISTKKKFFKNRINNLLNIIKLNIIYSRFLNTILEDFFYLYSYSYLILKEVVSKELTFLKLFFNQKTISKDSNNDFLTYYNSSLQVNPVNIFVSNVSNDTNSYLGLANTNSISKSNLINKFSNVHLNNLPNIKKIFQKNYKSTQNMSYSLNSSVDIQLLMNNLYYSFWSVGQNNVLTYSNKLSTQLTNLNSTRLSTFFYNKGAIVNSINFNSFLSLLNQGTPSNIEIFLLNYSLIQKFIILNFISPSFSIFYYHLSTSFVSKK